MTSSLGGEDEIKGGFEKKTPSPLPFGVLYRDLRLLTTSNFDDAIALLSSLILSYFACCAAFRMENDMCNRWLGDIVPSFHVRMIDFRVWRARFGCQRSQSHLGDMFRRGP